jgi:hypothetical protein
MALDITIPVRKRQQQESDAVLVAIDNLQKNRHIYES